MDSYPTHERGLTEVVEPSNSLRLMSLPDERAIQVHLGNWDLPPTSPVLVFHHGTPGWGHPGRHLLAACAERGVRVLGPTRAGYASSTRHVGRAIADVAQDVEVVLRELHIGRVVAVGVSGGGPHALATASRLADRVAAVASVAGLAPYGVSGLDFMGGMGNDNLDEYGAALDGESTLRAYLEREAPKITNVSAESLAESMATLLPPIDRAMVTGPLAADLVEQFTNSLEPGVEGWLDDDLAFISPWGFDVEALKGPSISIWQGGMDLMVPKTHGAWLASNIEGSEPHLLDEDGHLSIVVGRAGEIVDLLLTHW